MASSILVGMLIAASMADAASGWMFIGRFGIKGLPGCGAESSCDEMIRGRWSKWGRFPISGIGGMLYFVLTTLALLQTIQTPYLHPGVAMVSSTALAMLAGGAALWFIGLQAIVIHRWCGYCMAVHACGLVAALLMVWLRWRTDFSYFGISLAIASVGLAALIVGQLLLTPKTFAIMPPPAEPKHEESIPELIPRASRRIHAFEPARNRKVSLHGGRVMLDPSQFPIIGSPQAPNLIAYFLDYTCDECHHLHRLLFEVIDHYAERLAIVPILFPLNKSCNPANDCPKQEHAQACAYARLSLAVWTANPEGYEEWDKFMVHDEDPQPFGLALAKAQELADIHNFSLKETDTVLDPRIAACIDLYEAAGKPQLPCILLPGGALIGRVPSKAVLLDLLERHLFALQAK